MSILFITLMIVSVLFFDFAGLISGFSKLIDYASYFRRYDTILALGCAISVFLYALNFSFSSPFINRIAGATLGIYLIHNNALIDTYIWKVLYPNTEYIYNPYAHAILKIFVIFSVSLIIELIRQATVGKMINKWLDRHYQKIWNGIKWASVKFGNILDIVWTE